MEAYQGLSTQGKTALVLGLALVAGTEAFSRKPLGKPVHTLISLGVVALTTYTVECLATPRRCSTWAWINVGILGLNVLGVYAARYMQEIAEEQGAM